MCGGRAIRRRCDAGARRLDARADSADTRRTDSTVSRLFVRRMSQVLDLSQIRRRRGRVYFNRGELGQLLSLYFDRVAAGEWRDYAIDHGVGIAVFSVFRHSQDRPLYGIAKVMGAQGVEYCVYEGRHRLRRGRTLAEVLELFERRLTLVRD
ncbi:DUF2794 domain-containing protein [Inquilinus limosus]|uniref:DUF2794 domain-containing protein n=1 Tax=Inquilinus limosus TaxID=171674 RepID=UPI000417B9BE